VPAGFDEFFREQFPRLCLFLMRTGADRHEAEECAQEVMLQAIQHWRRLESPAAWVRIAAMRTLANRAQRDRIGKSRELAANNVREVAPLSEDLAELSEQQRQVLSVLRQLPDAQRRVMAWVVDGFSATEIAKMMNTPAATVRSNIRHARAALRKMLDDVDQPAEGRTRS